MRRRPLTHPAAERLLGWYERERRDLPWRRKPTPYRVWVSEVMLQQTRVETVLPYFERFMARFPTVEALARAQEDEVLALWSGLGYYSRARALLEGARKIVREYGGAFPPRIEDALRIPGVGPYTAAAVLSIAYGQPHPVLDGNVERVLARLLLERGDPKSSTVRRRLLQAAAEWLPHSDPGAFNQALMELGATVCTPRNPRCELCPLSRDCKARARGLEGRIPGARRRRKTEEVELEAAVIARNGRFLLERSPRLGYLKSVWVFPHNETRREGPVAARLEELLGTRLCEIRRLRPVRHAVTYRKLAVVPVLFEAQGRVRADGRTLRWSEARELRRGLATSSLALKILERYERSRRT